MIDRIYTRRLVEQASRHQISVLIGSRQVGKSTLLRIIQEKLQSDCNIFDLENPLHLALCNEGYTSFIRYITTSVVFIDEFQYCNSISSIFKAIYDLNPNIKVYASGSSSLEIQKHLHESLAGRKIETIVYPLTFSEFVNSKDLNLPAFSSPLTPTNPDLQEKYKTVFDEFVCFGGLPGLVDLHDPLDKREYLFGIYKTYIAKDIKSFLREESVLSFNKMLSWLALNNGSQLNKSSLSKITGISSRQIDRYLEVLQGTFVVNLVPPFSGNKNKELSKMNKFYLYDQGIVNTIIQDFRPLTLRSDSGTVREMFVYWELKKHVDIRFSLYYWRTTDQKEVDFVLEKDREMIPIEVKSDWDVGKVPSGIRAFLNYYPEVTQAVVVYEGSEELQQLDGCMVYWVPIHKAAKIPELFS